jgi:uncharacterized protein YfaS (alpha-2-macroglobulin family)
MKITSLLAPLARLVRGLRSLLVAVFGRIGWQPPLWLAWIGAKIIQLARRPVLALAVAATLLATAGGGWYGWQWYCHLPQPHTVDYAVESPALTNYEKSPNVIAPLRVRFHESAAPLALVGKQVTSGLRLEPAQNGSWRWLDDHTLEFRPEGDWPVDSRFTLALAQKGLLAPGVLLKRTQATFHTAPFTATIKAGELYQDPVDSTLKKLVATVDFSHPVNASSLRRAISLKLGEGLAFRDPTREPWTLTVDSTGLHAHIHTAPLNVPLESTPITLMLDRGVATVKGGNSSEQPIQRAVEVPGRYRLTFTNLETRYITNPQGEAQQVLMFDSAFPVRDEVIGRHVHAWLLPERPGQEDTEPFSEADLTAPLALTHIPSAEPLNSHHSFTFHVPVNRRIVVRIDAQIEAVGGYLSKKDETRILHTGEYPKVVRLLGDGALLSLRGEQQIGFMAQGVPGIRVEVARLLPGQLHQIVDQNFDRFAQPSVYAEQFDRLVERMEYTRAFTAMDPAKPLYDAIDLRAYLNAEGGRRGVFVLRLTPYDPAQPNREYGDPPRSPAQGDRRFLLVTDLGLISKRTLDGGQEVFVQSIRDGNPIANVKIEVVGRNGLAVAEGFSDERGHVRFAQMDDLKRERTPIMLVASLGNDLSFLPLGRDEHQVDFSRFDIGGAANESSPEQITAQLFTDRGLYRPGETVHLGMILRPANWTTTIEGVPVEIEITDPKGMVAWNQQRRCTASGFDGLDYEGSVTAPSGEYSVSLYLVQNNRRTTFVGSTTFTVREFEPDRLKVDLRLAEGPAFGWLRPEEIKPLVKARHLFGADASDRRVTARMRLSPALPAFKPYPHYRFHVEGGLKDPVDESLAETRTGAGGEATLVPDLARFAQATYRLRLTARVYEADGGRNVAAEQEILVSAAPSLIGVHSPDPLDYVSKGAVRTCRWLAINPALQPVAAEGLSLALIEYRSVSVLVKQANGVYKYESRRQEVLRDSRPINLSTEGTETPLPTAEPGDFAYEIRDGQGTVLNRIGWTVAGAANLSRSLERNAELQIKLDKASYAPGETIQISLRAPYTGSGLITIERDRVYAHAWFQADTTSSVQTITVPRGLEGNGYVTVQFMRDPNSPEVFMSPLSSGVAPFSVALDARRLPLALHNPELIEPGQQLHMRLTPGEPARAVVFAVDEGILQVARYKTPDPLGQFFQKRALDVQTSQILSLILPEFSRLMAAAAPGGDGEDLLGAHLNPFKRKRQGPVAYWSGVVDVPAEGRSFDYLVPEGFNGRLRLMAVAVTPQRIGVVETATEVRGPWVLTPNIPAFVAPGDQFSVSVGAFNNSDTDSLLDLHLETGPGLALMGEERQALPVASRREGVAIFRLQATETLGSTDLTFWAASKEGKVRIREPLSVRPATPYRVGLRAGRFTEAAFSLQQQRDLFDQHRTVELGVDFSPLVWTRGLTTYLEQYPYSCTEQLLSRAMPALIMAPPAELANPDFKPLQTAFTLLRQRQNEAGGFGQWATNLEVQPDISIYAADFLIEAQERGAIVPRDLEQQAMAYLQQIAHGPAEGMEELRTKARAIYLLTRTGKVTSAALAALLEQLEQHHRDTWRTDLAAAYGAATQALLKQRREAEQLMAQVAWRTLLPAAGRMAMGLFDDGLSHDAELLALQARHFPGQLIKIPEPLLPALGDALSHDQYHSFAAAQLIRAFDLYGREIKAMNKGEAIGVEVSRVDGGTQPLAPAGRPPLAALPSDWTKVILRKDDGALPAFYQLTEAGFDRQPPAGPLQRGIEVHREYVREDGTPLTSVKVGEEFTVRLQVRATDRDRISEIAIVDLLPGGLEPVIAMPAEAPQEEVIEGEDGADEQGAPSAQEVATGWEPTFVETRDDRVILYAGLSRQVATYAYQVRATNAGTFRVPPPYAEGMYQRSLQGRGESGTLTIVAP